MSQDPPIVPGPIVVITPAIDAIVAARPNALGPMNTGGRYSHLPIGWRAQAALHFRRTADEAMASRLYLAKGKALRELAASEYETVLDETPRAATGHVTITRSLGSLGQGVIRQGTAWRILSNPTATPIPIAAANFTTRAPVYVAPGQLSVTVPLIATAAGTNSNVVQTTGASSTLIQPATGTVFDPNFAVTACFSGGGSQGIQDDDIQRAADAYGGGQYGPTDKAVLVGAYRVRGVRYLAYFNYYPQSAVGAFAVAQLFVADRSWGSSPEWSNEIAQTISDEVLGFGCRVFVGTVSNHFIKVSATVRVRSSQDAFDTTDLQARIRAAVRSYFDDRIDWYLWSLQRLRAAIISADDRIQTCTSVAVLDAATNVAITAPSFSPAALAQGIFGPSGELIHYYAADNAVDVTVQPPT